MIGKLTPFFRIYFSRGIPGSKWNLLKTLVSLAVLKRTDPHNKPVSISFGKQTIYGPDYPLISFLLKEKFVAQQYYFKTEHAAPVIVDVGANIGISALYFKALYPDATIHCFEPYSKAFQFLNLNISVNKLNKVFLYNMAVAVNDGPVDLHVPEEGGMINASIQQKKNTATSTETVEAVRLSHLLGDIPTVALLKMDVEGAEFNIMTELKDSGVLSSKKIKQFVVEYHYDPLQDPRQLTAFLQMLGDNHYETRSVKVKKEDPASDLLIHAWQDH